MSRVSLSKYVNYVFPRHGTRYLRIIFIAEFRNISGKLLTTPMPRSWKIRVLTPVLL